MITAEEARALTELSSLQVVLERIESKIKKDAVLGEEETVYRYAKEEGLDMYPPENKRNLLTRRVVAELRSKGFCVDTYYKEHSIAADIGIKISWRKP